MATVVQVLSACVVVRDPSGAQHMFLRGAVLPGGLDDAHVELLLADGMVAEVELPDEVAEPVGTERPTRKRAASPASD